MRLLCRAFWARHWFVCKETSTFFTVCDCPTSAVFERFGTTLTFLRDCQMRLLCQVLRDNFDFMQENIQTVWFRIFCFRASVVPKVLSTTWIFKVKWVSCAEPFWHDTDLYAERSSKLPDCWFSFSYWFPPKELNTTLTFKAQWVCCVEPLRHDTDFYANIQSRLPDCRFSLPF